MKVTRSQSGSAVLAGPAPAPSTGPVELTDMQLDQVAGGGVAGDRVNHQNIPIPNRGGAILDMDAEI